MKLLLCLALGSLTIYSCKQDEDPAVSNTYSITVRMADVIFGPTSTYTFHLLKDDVLIATGSGVEYIFTELEEGHHYTVIPQPLEPSKNGLSTIDVVKIGQFIDGTASPSAIEQLVADVNLDGVINEADVAIVTNCITMNVDCPGWRFATDNYDGAGTGSADKVDYPQLFGNQQVTFTVFKLGDINCTTCPG